MYYSDDPARDYLNYDADVQERISKLPKCEDCDNHIQEDYYYNVDGTILCEDCLHDRYRLHTDDYEDTLNI